MHDINEGVCHTFFAIFFGSLVDHRILSKSKICEMVRDYNYGFLNIDIKPSIIKLDGKPNFNQNASQTHTLLIHLPYIFYEQKTQLDSVWQLLEKLLQIVQILYSTRIEEKDIQRLSILIREYLSDLVARKKRLTAKHHNMIHYPTVIRKMGPLIHMWAMRMESKHTVFTTHFKNLNCYKNPTLSLSIRHEQLASFELHQFQTEIKESARKTKLQTCLNFNLYKQLNIFDDSFLTENWYALNFLKMDSFDYRIGMMLIRDNSVLEIEDIIAGSNRHFFVCCNYKISRYANDLNSIEIEKMENDFTLLNISLDERNKPYEKKWLNDKMFIIADSLNVYSNFH